MLASSFALGLALLAPSIYAQNCPSGPTGQSYFSPVLLNDQVYIVGGSLETLDIYALDLSQGLDTSCPSWSTPSNVQNNGQYKPFMYGVAYAGPSNNTIYVQSGIGGTDQMARLVQYNTAGSWGGVSEFGNSPSSRARMSASLNGTGTAFYYGGRAIQSKDYYNDFYSLDTRSNTWNWPAIQYGWGQAPPRYDHSAVLIDDLLFILGGIVNINGTDIFADFRSAVVFDTVSNKALSMATTGDIPPGRYAFSAAPAPDGKSIVVFGGHNISAPSGTFDGTADVYVLDTCTLTWSKPDISGTAPAARAGHGAVTYGNYMLVMFGFTDVVPLGDYRSPKYINNLAILDMSSWKWISSISHQDNPTAKADPGCSFSFPSFPETQADGGDDPMPYDPTVISNPNKKSNKSRNTGLAVGFALFALIILVGGVYWWRRRQKQKARATNPRWLPGAVTMQRRGSNDYPLFVYGNEDSKEEKFAETRDAGMRTYTATDHDAWERALNQDQERPEDGRPMSRHMDVWERMRGLRDQQEAKTAESKLVDA